MTKERHVYIDQIGAIEKKVFSLLPKMKKLARELLAIDKKTYANWIKASEIELDVNNAEAKITSIKSEMSNIEEKIRMMLNEIMPYDRGVRTIRQRISRVEKHLKHAVIKIMAFERKIKVFRNKLRTATSEHPYIKQYKFSVTK